MDSSSSMLPTHYDDSSFSPGSSASPYDSGFDDTPGGDGGFPDLFVILNEFHNESNHSSISLTKNPFQDTKLNPEESYAFPSPYSPQFRALFTVMYTLLTLVSLIGNSTVCYVVLRNRRMRTVTNFFLASQATSDVIMTFFNIPFIVMKEMLRSWPFGLVLCHLVDFVGVMSVYVSTFTLTAIAVDRHRVIVHPLKPRITMATAILITVFIWALAGLLSLPFLVWKQLNHAGDYVICHQAFPVPYDLFSQLVTYGTLVFQFLIPLVVITTSYFSIGYKLWSRTAVGDVIESQQAANARMKFRTTRMLIAVVAVFSICWLPLEIYLLIVAHIGSYKKEFVYLSLHWFAMLSVCISPIAFCLLNENFRKDIKSAIGRLSLKIFRKTPDKVTRRNLEDVVGGTKSQDTFANTMSKEINTLSEDIALMKSSSSSRKYSFPRMNNTVFDGKGIMVKFVVPIATIDVSEA